MKRFNVLCVGANKIQKSQLEYFGQDKNIQIITSQKENYNAVLCFSQSKALENFQRPVFIVGRRQSSEQLNFSKQMPISQMISQLEEFLCFQ
ncbi:MAG: hypothetical protein AAF549_03325 [Pseudomonadota bacterium]